MLTSSLEEVVLKFYIDSSKLFSSSDSNKKADFFQLCLRILKADYALLFESLDEHSVQLVESFPETVLQQKFTNPSLLKKAFDDEGSSVGYFPLEKDSFVTLNFDALQELSVISAFGVSSSNETSSERKNVVLFCYTKKDLVSKELSQIAKLITPRVVEILKNDQREISFASTSSRLQSILKTIPQAIVFVDTETDISWINENAAKLFSLSPGAHPSYNISEAMRNILTTTSNLPEIKSEMAIGLSDPNNEGFTSYWILHMPEKKVYQVQSQIIRGRKSPGRLWLFDDVTAVHAHRETLTLLNSALREKSESVQKENLAKTVFVSKLSHEIRTPLTGIIGLTELLLSQEHKTEIAESLELIHKSGLNLLKTINHFLDFSKLEMSKMDLESLPFSLPDLLRDLRKLLDTEAKKNNNRILLDIQKDFPNSILGDSLRTGQIFTNLIGNALKFTKDGTITIRIRCVNLDLSNIRIHAQVLDNGIGISSSKIDSIFEPFVQTDVSTTRNFGGTGLGLSVTKNLVSLFGGSIEVKSEVGSGTEFSFYWDTEIAEEDLAKKEILDNPQNDSKDYSDLSVLVVEDNLVNQQLISRILGKYKITPFIVDNGEEAVELSYHNKYDLIFMDINLPGIDGFATAEILRGTTNGNFAKIYGLTANVASELSKKSSFRFMDGLLSKPYDIKQIGEMLANLLKERKS
ncbi:hybrid sensor histidine kinase/response regulator [Leptospira kobayashii]|uniref:histidine kinase n=1 Tax=Leptospira kobayashii TaxID=1917830 RepID=A0ABN6KNN3_9LEPT|nr:ATP-binding protein [Leptospira kobayashii]BDA80550.1 hybrid sensor histidine kinase/response regulator [Leptospira kobayashii]